MEWRKISLGLRRFIYKNVLKLYILCFFEILSKPCMGRGLSRSCDSQDTDTPNVKYSSGGLKILRCRKILIRVLMNIFIRRIKILRRRKILICSSQTLYLHQSPRLNSGWCNKKKEFSFETFYIIIYSYTILNYLINY